MSSRRPVCKVSAEKKQVGTLTKKIHIQVPPCIFSAETLRTGRRNDRIFTTFKETIETKYINIEPTILVIEKETRKGYKYGNEADNFYEQWKK